MPTKIHFRLSCAALGLLALAACLPPQFAVDPSVAENAPDTCFHTTTTPAVFETVTQQIIVPASGADGAPAMVLTQTLQQIVQERREVTFEILCDDLFTSDFVASLQRALRARGYATGPATGTMNPATLDAIEQFQIAQNDVATPVLTLRTARTLGLIKVARDPL